MPHDLAQLRADFAVRVMQEARVNDPRLQSAFATVPREAFLGPGPWRVIPRRGHGYAWTPDDHPRHVLQDILVAIDPARGLNNGQPSFHARLIHALAPAAGERLVHVGAGTGYYSAILAELVGPSGHVLAIEAERDLARQAGRNLADRANVQVRHGAARRLPAADGIYVSAGATHPPPAWLRALNPGGRLLLPLTTSGEGERSGGEGSVFLFTRTAAGFSARFVSWVAIWPAAGARRREDEAALLAALKRGGAEFVRGLRLGGGSPDRCWLWRPDWALTWDEPGGAGRPRSEG
jgi:protein-L-isoaspartate(D-aspartate) O-methyltransferase